MAISFVAAGSLGVNATAASQAISQPTCSVGDLLIAFVFSRSVSNNVISPPDGTWTQIYQAFNGGAIVYAAFWKKATATTGSHTFTKASDDSRPFGGVIAAYSGVGASPIDATTPGASVNVSADNVTFPAFDPTSTSAHVIFAAYYQTNSTTFAAAMSSDTNPDCTTRFDVETSLGSAFSLAMTSGDSDGSNIASRTWASNSTSDAANVGVVFAIAPSAIKTILGLTKTLVKTVNSLAIASVKTVNGLA